MDKELITYLENFLTTHRKNLFRKVLQNRTRYITVVLEDLYQSHNASAVLRTCECFGVQDIHIIENKNEYTINPDVTLGASKWLNLIKYNTKDKNTREALIHLHTQGYRIISAVPGNNATSLYKFDLDKGKAALLFGTELTGLSDEALSLADEQLTIPMYGFTESFNISVAAGIILGHLIPLLHRKNYWKLSMKEQEIIYFDWLKKSIKTSDQIIRKRKA